MKTNRMILLLLLLSSLAAGLAHADNLPSASALCSPGGFDPIYSMAAIAAIATAGIIALGYMFGEFFQNPRLITWAKTEVLQVFVSVILVLAVAGIANSFCQFQIGDVATVFSSTMPEIYHNYPTANLYDAAGIYLENLIALAHTNLVSLRWSAGAYEIRTTYTYFDCDKGCWLSMIGSNVAQYSGESLALAATNNLMGTATIAYLTAIFQFFTLQYINNGLFAIFLPIAIVMRAMPFMRQFGGALIVIFLSLYIMYPLTLILNSVVAAGMVQSPISFWHYPDCPGTDLLHSEGTPLSSVVNCNTQYTEKFAGVSKTENYDESQMDLSVGEVLAGTMPPPAPLDQQTKSGALIFFISVFLPALDFIVIVAMARGASQILGEEVDLSRLSQMV